MTSISQSPEPVNCLRAANAGTQSKASIPRYVKAAARHGLASEREFWAWLRSRPPERGQRQTSGNATTDHGSPKALGGYDQ